MKEKLVTVGVVVLVIVSILLITILAAVGGAVSLGLTGAILAGFAWIFELINIPTAKAVVIWFAGVGAVLGPLRTFLIIGIGMIDDQ